MEFPTFPEDESEYRDWRQLVDIWINANPKINDSKRMQCLKNACLKNKNVYSLAKSIDIKKMSFEKCLKKLDERFLIVQNIFLEMVENLINLEDGTDAENLMNLNNTFLSTLISMESLIRQYVVKSDDTDDENISLQVKAKMFDAVVGALINRKLDDETCSQNASELNVTTHEIPDPFKILEVIETNFIELQDSAKASKKTKASASETFIKSEKRSTRIVVK